MPWSASALFAPAYPDLKEAWSEHPALAKGLHHFARLPHCRMPAVGLLAVADLLPPHRCGGDRQIPWDALIPRRRFDSILKNHQPPGSLLAALSEMSTSAPILFYQGETHGGETIHEESWIFADGKIERYRSNPLVTGMAAIGVAIPPGGWFEPFTGPFHWKPYFIGGPAIRPTPGSLLQACQFGCWSEVEEMLAKGHPATGYLHPTPVTWALRQNRLDIARLLHRHEHPLGWLELSQCRSAAAVNWMLEQGVEVTPCCGLIMLENGCADAWRALGGSQPEDEVFLAACRGGVFPVVESLLRKKPEFIHLIRMGDSPLVLAARRGDAGLCELLLSCGANWDEGVLYEAAGQGHVELVQRALSAGVSVNGRRWGHSALNHAASRGHLSVLQGVAADLNLPDQYGVTPLQAAALAGQEAVVDWLIRQGVDLEARDDGGCTALWSAVASGKQQLVDRLLRAGANPEVQNAYGDTLALLAEGRQIQLPARQHTTATSPLHSDHQQ